MPLVKRAESDMMRFVGLADVLVNPVNTMGAMGAGLALAFAEKFPQMLDEYRRSCKDGTFKVGNTQVYKDSATGAHVVNIATKEHFANPAELEYIRKGLRALREYLQENPTFTVAMPMLGCGLGQLSMDEVEPLNAEYLDDLPNIIHVCMRPDAFVSPPKYLGIIGSRILTDYDYVEKCVFSALKKWDLKIEDFAAIVSGGAIGVDELGAGKLMTDDEGASYEKSFAKKWHPALPIIVRPDYKRFGMTAAFIRNRTVADILTHGVVCVDERKKVSKGTRHTVNVVKMWNEDNPDNQKRIIGNYYPTPPE